MQILMKLNMLKGCYLQLLTKKTKGFLSKLKQVFTQNG